MNKKTRIKIQLPNLATRDGAEAAMRELSELVNHQRSIVANRDAASLKVNESFAGQLGMLAEAISAKTDALRVWAETNPEQFQNGRKSIEFVSGVLGFRTGNLKLALLSRSWTWDKVTEKIKTSLPNFIRQKPEVDKEAIIGQRAELAAFLPACGVKVVQDESFYVEPALSNTDARQTQPAEIAA